MQNRNNYGELLSDTQFVDPWRMEDNRGFLEDKNLLQADKLKWSLKKDSVEVPSGLQDLQYILSDVLSGDPDAAKRPEFTCLNVASIVKAINWLVSTDKVSDLTRKNLIECPYNLVFKKKPPTISEFLTEEFIGAQATTMYEPVRKALEEFWDPLKPYRTLVLEQHIGWGKSLALTLSYLFCSTHFGLMRSPWAFFGQAQPLDSKILTADGWRELGSLSIGDFVFSPTVGFSKIEEIRDWGEIDCYEVEFEDGRKTRCNENHLWPCENGVFTLEQMIEKDYFKFSIISRSLSEVQSSYNELLRTREEKLQSDWVPLVCELGRELKTNGTPKAGKTLSQKIKYVKFIGKVAQRCITLEDESGLYVTDQGIITHNSPATVYTTVMCGATIKKASELLIEPFENILIQAPFFKKVRRTDDMQKEEQNFLENNVTDYIPYTSASRTSEIAFAGGNNYKLISSPSGLLGQTIIMGGISEINFFKDVAGWSEERIFKFFSKIRGRIVSRMKGNYYGRFVVDSSPSSYEDEICAWAFEEAPKNATNLVLTGSRWHYFPEDFSGFMVKNEPGETYTTPQDFLKQYHETHDVKKGFPLFKGGRGLLPSVIEFEDQLAATEQVDIVWCPNESITPSGIESYKDMAKENPIEFLRDYAGLPSNSADRIFYLNETIENCFENKLRNIYGSIRAPMMEDPEHLIWNAVSPIFFYKIFNRNQYYYHPEAPRVLSVDQSESKDMASIAVSHVCFNPDKVDPKTSQPMIEYVTDFTIMINPKGGLVNLDAIKFFVLDLRNLGGMPITHASFDGFEARSTKQFLLRQGVDVDYLSVDRDTKPYQTFISIVHGGRWHCGKNIFTKNNMKSLQITKRKGTNTVKIDHMKGDLVYDYLNDWATDRAGIYAKDALDAVCGNVALLEMYGNEYPPVYAWDLEGSAGRTIESVNARMTETLGKIGLRKY